MSTHNNPRLDQISFEKMRRIVPNLLESHRTRPLPEEIAFKLTNRCDLRCTHCYQWNERGYHHDLTPAEKNGDLDLAIVKKVLAATKPIRSNVYLWGGEPLVYRHWDGLVEALADDPRWTSVCTNGTLIETRLQSILRISSHLEVSISLDGFEPEHDRIRGGGSWQKARTGIRLLVEQRKTGAFLGEITVNFVVSDGMADRMFEFLDFLESENVDTAYVSFPWFISDETSAQMDRYYTEHFSCESNPRRPSWHGYKFGIDPHRIDGLNAQVARIDARKWLMKVRYNPRLDPGDMKDFILGSSRPAQNKTRCHAIRTRMDIFPDGDVVSCKFFPEFHVGNLRDADFSDVWLGERFDHVRETVSRCGLMPVCAKCNLLYTRGR